jgi:hypothetical protein
MHAGFETPESLRKPPFPIFFLRVLRASGVEFPVFKKTPEAAS